MAECVDGQHKQVGRQASFPYVGLQGLVRGVGLPEAHYRMPTAPPYGGQAHRRLPASLPGIGHGGLAREAALIDVDHGQRTASFSLMQREQVLLGGGNKTGSRCAFRLLRQRFQR